MKDRVSNPNYVLSNGAIRYAEYDGEGNFIQYRYLVLDDDPSDPGTPLNKANLLSDATAGILGFSSSDSANVDQALAKMIYSQRFTYVVDSNEKLASWALNASGYDYTSVLIKPGIWTSASGVNLTNAGTKIVVGEAGSLLSFTGQTGLYYSDGIGANESCFMVGIVLTVTGTANSASGFSGCENLYNCSATVRASGSSGSYVYSYGFISCNNLYNCHSDSDASGGTGQDAYSFHGCSNLFGCVAIRENDISESYFGFFSCSNLFGCSADIESHAQNASGFFSCSKLVSCFGKVMNTGGQTNVSLGFNQCDGMILCAGSDYSNCCASQGAYNATYEVSNSPNGGFNNF